MANLMSQFAFKEPIYVTRPTMPAFDDFVAKVATLWETGWLTNNGPFHEELAHKIRDVLEVTYCSLINNGTTGLIIALQALQLSGEVITTPFTFPATPNALIANGLTPVFCDISPTTFNIDPDKIETLITSRTIAILPVHVYGTPCDVEAIADLAERYNLRVVYDAAHAFGVKLHGRSLATYGDISMYSLHATKIFSTIEGGALVTKDEAIRQQVEQIKNFGMSDPETIEMPGLNGKLNELQACYGLLHLEMLEEEIQRRKHLAQL